MVVISRYRFEALHRFFGGSKAEQAFSVWKEFAIPGVLDDGRLTARQITEHPNANTGIMQFHARGFHTAEVSPGRLYASSVVTYTASHFPRVLDAPSMLHQV